MPRDRPSVWAPNATDVRLYVNDRTIAMQSVADGWWLADIALAPGDRYGFILDGTGPFPDPRSPFQPDGVHGLSQVIDHVFPWSDQGWHPPHVSGAVMYELHIGTFTEEGTFDAAVQRLDALVDLGISHVEIMPVAEFSGTRGWGYDGVDLYAPHHSYGGPQALKRFVDACHARGLAVILDVVYNHLGPSGNYLERYGPYFTDRYRTPWGRAVNLDGPGSDQIRQFFCDNALMWLRDYHFDGLRLDAVHAFVDTSATHFLEQLATEVRHLESGLGRRLLLIAESDLNDPRILRPPDVGGYGVDAQWNDDFHHALHVVLTGERSGYYEDFATLDDLATALSTPFVYAGRYSAYRRRTHGRPADDIPGWRFVVAAQNHDQVGNRAKGERLSHLVSLGRLKVAAALTLTSPYVPLLFQGEEWAASTPFLYFTAHEDEELGERVREGRRAEFAPFGWDPDDVPDPQAFDSFARSRVSWPESATGHHAEMREWYRALIALRRSTPSLRDGVTRYCEVDTRDEKRVIVLRRRGITVICNVGPCSYRVPIDECPTTVLASQPDARVEASVAIVPPDSVLVLRTNT